MPGARRSYWADTRAPRYAVAFAAPLLVLYEASAFVLTGDLAGGVRNGADVLLKTPFLALGGVRGLALFAVLLFGAGAWFVWDDWRRARDFRLHLFPAMFAEALVYALLLGGTASRLTEAILRPLALGPIGAGGFDLRTQLMISLGAGLYEELLFRVLLVGVLFAVLVRRGWTRWIAGVTATVAGAVVFSAFHYIGAYGDALELGSFTFRAVAGVLFSGLYLTRGFGITAWAHALYDVVLTMVLAQG